MGFSQFPEKMFFAIPAASDSPVSFGKIDLTNNQEIRHIQTHVVKKGAHAAGTKFRMHISPNETYNVPIVTSAWVDVSEIDSLTASHWIGYITFTFDRTPLEADNDYWVHFEITGYTASASYFWGFALDWPDAVNTTNAEAKAGGLISLLGYE